MFRKLHKILTKKQLDVWNMLNKTSFAVLFLAYVKFLEGFTQHFWLPVWLPSWNS